MPTGRAEDPGQPRMPPDPEVFLFCGFILDPQRGGLGRPDGSKVMLRSKATEVLRHLAWHAGAFVSRDDLMDAVWLKVRRDRP